MSDDLLRQIADDVRNIRADVQTVHGDVKVAMDRTSYQSGQIRQLQEHMGDHCREIARAKGLAASVGAGTGLVGWLLAEFGSRLFGGHH